jgi:hypothetical protein
MRQSRELFVGLVARVLLSLGAIDLIFHNSLNRISDLSVTLVKLKQAEGKASRTYSSITS